VIVSTFLPEGPTKCSGLDVVRCNAESLVVSPMSQWKLRHYQIISRYCKRKKSVYHDSAFELKKEIVLRDSRRSA
jgi:hypothetical protein